MKKNSFLIAVCTLLVSAMSFGQGPKFYLDFEGSSPLSSLPSGVTNVNSTNTVRIKNTTNYPASPNVVQSDGAGGKELFLDFQGHLKVNVPNPSNGFTLAYDYRRNNANDDWWLGFLTFIGNDGTSNKLERIQIKEWSGQLNFANNDSFNPYPIWFDTDYKIVITCSTTGDISLYVDNVLKLSVPNATSGLNLHTWTNASLLLSFKGESFDGTNVTPEGDYASNARDSRVFVDNVALFERELTLSEVNYINTNGNNTNPTTTVAQGAKFYLDFEGASPLIDLPSGVANVNGTNTVRVKNTTDYPAIPNAVQSDGGSGKELFLDFHGYLKTDIPDPSKGFTLAYDYRRNNANDDWWLGFLTFIGNDGSSNRLEQLLIKEWSGQLSFSGLDSFNPYPIWFDTDYKIVITCSAGGDIKVYVDNVLKLSVPNATSGKNIHTWTNASLLLSFKGNSFDGNSVTPEADYASTAKDSRVFVDNVALFERELSSANVEQLFNNGNNTFGIISQIPTAALTFCKGATVATAVGTASLKFYAALTGGTALAGTSALTTKTYFVTEMIGAAESTPRVAVVVTINALPTEVIGTITSNSTSSTTTTGFVAATLAVGPFVGTTNTVSYRVPAFVGTNSYFWTVPVGVRIVGQDAGTRTVTQTGANANVLNVNYSGIAAGIGAVGAITVQAQNATGCNGAARSVAISKILPLAPAAITMHDLSLLLPTSGIPTAVRSFAKYMGTTAVLRLTATPSLTATSYEWNLPAGVNQLSGGTTNIITVNFAGVTSGNTFNFNTTAATPVSTNVLRIGVKAVNGVGVSTTSNTALANPSSTSTARLLTLTAVRPAAPTLKMFDMAVSNSVAVTDISRYIGTNTPLTLVGTVAATSVASSFSWELPAGVNVVSGSLTSNSIVVNFLNVPAGTASLYVGIRAVNGMGASVKNNSALLPATGSSASLLKLSAGLPSAAGTVVGSLAICSNQASSVTYTITAAAAKTNLYNITSPAGTTIAGGSGNTRTINAVAGATFTVIYPNGFTSVRPTQRTISIQSVNGFGVSTLKVLTLTSNTCTASARNAKVAPAAEDFKVIAYPNPSTGVFNLAIESSKASSTTIQVYDMQGRMIENKQVNTNAVEIGANYTSGIYNVILENAGQAKTIRLIKK